MSEVQDGLHSTSELAEQSGPPPSSEEVAEWEKSIELADPEFSSWCAFARDNQKKGADLCRSAASTLITITAMLFTGYVAFMRWSIVADKLTGFVHWILPLPLILWAVAGCALVVFLLPWDWSALPAAGDIVKREFLRFVRRRTRWVRAIGGVILLGALCAIYVFVKTTS